MCYIPSSQIHIIAVRQFCQYQSIPNMSDLNPRSVAAFGLYPEMGKIQVVGINGGRADGIKLEIDMTGQDKYHPGHMEAKVDFTFFDKRYKWWNKRILSNTIPKNRMLGMTCDHAGNRIFKSDDSPVCLEYECGKGFPIRIIDVNKDLVKFAGEMGNLEWLNTCIQKEEVVYYRDLIRLFGEHRYYFSAEIYKIVDRFVIHEGKPPMDGMPVMKLHPRFDRNAVSWWKLPVKEEWIFIEKSDYTRDIFTVDQIDLPITDASVREHLSAMSAGQLRSLIQKACRIYSNYMKMPNGRLVKTADIAVYGFVYLVAHAGNYHAELQKYVTGRESAFKRLGVILAEDAAIDDNAYWIKWCLRHAGFHASCRDFYPTLDAVRQGMEIIRQAATSNVALDYKKKHLGALKDTEYLDCYNLLKNIGSFDGDIEMMRSLAQNDGRFAMKAVDGPVEIVPFVSYVCFHCFRSLAYLDLCSKSTMHSRNQHLFKTHTGFNPRRVRSNTFEYSKRVEFWQTFVHSHSVLKIPLPEIEIHPDVLVDLKVQLPNEYCSLMVGELTKSSSKGIVVLSSDGSHDESIVIPKPMEHKRLPVDRVLTEIEKQDVLREVRGLKKKIRNGPLKDAYCSLNPVTQMWEINGESFFSIRQRLQDVRIPVQQRIVPTEIWNNSQLACSLLTSSSSIAANYEEHLNFMRTQLSPVILNRINYLAMTSSNDFLILGSPSLNGKWEINAGDQIWFDGDHDLFAALLCISAFAPCAIQFSHLPAFKIMDKRILFEIIHKTRSFPVQTVSKWTDLKPSSVDYYDYQVQAIDHLLLRLDTGLSKSYLSAKTGMGKSVICLGFIRTLIQQKRCPPTVVWFVNKSAMKCIQKECDKLGIPSVIWTAGHFLHGKVNIMDYNKVRTQIRNMIPQASNCLVVADEADLLNNPTQRMASVITFLSIVPVAVMTSATPIGSKVKHAYFSKMISLTMPYVDSTNIVAAQVHNMIICKVDNPIQVNMHINEIILIDRDAYQSTPFDKKIGFAVDLCWNHIIEIAKSESSVNFMIPVRTKGEALWMKDEIGPDAYLVGDPCKKRVLIIPVADARGTNQGEDTHKVLFNVMEFADTKIIQTIGRSTRVHKSEHKKFVDCHFFFVKDTAQERLYHDKVRGMSKTFSILNHSKHIKGTLST